MSIELHSESYKIVLIGDGGVGKTTFLRRFKNYGWSSEYIPTIGVNVIQLTFYTNYGLIKFSVWDCAGQEKNLNSTYYNNADGAIIMFDLTSKISYKHVPNWIESLRKVSPDAHVVICGNKSDINYGKVTHKDKQKHLQINWNSQLTYYDISTKSAYNYDKPFLCLMRQFTTHSDLEFVNR